MSSLASLRRGAWAASAAAPAGARTAVNLSALKLRIRATNNVAKITNVMKMVASSKLKSVEDMLSKGKAFGQSLLNALALKEAPRSRDEKDADSALGVFADAKKNLCVVITTDRGLCGSVNSSLTRSLRREIAESSRTTGADLRLFILGEKGRAQVARDYTPMMARSLDGYLDRDPVFSLAAAIASRIIAEPYDIVTLWYNEYENQVKFSGVYKKLPQLAALPTGQMPESLKKYESEPAGPELLINLQEYAVAAALYYALLETVACETSQRVTAMDNASTNAKDMVSRFKLLYNRARQAKITTELTEIISGSESLVVSTVSD